MDEEERPVEVFVAVPVWVDIVDDVPAALGDIVDDDKLVNDVVIGVFFVVVVDEQGSTSLSHMHLVGQQSNLLPLRLHRVATGPPETRLKWGSPVKELLS